MERLKVCVCVFWFGISGEIRKSIYIKFAFFYGNSSMKMSCALQSGCGRQNNAPPPTQDAYMLILGISVCVMLHGKRKPKLLIS